VKRENCSRHSGDEDRITPPHDLSLINLFPNTLSAAARIPIARITKHNVFQNSGAALDSIVCEIAEDRSMKLCVPVVKRSDNGEINFVTGEVVASELSGAFDTCAITNPMTERTINIATTAPPLLKILSASESRDGVPRLTMIDDDKPAGALTRNSERTIFRVERSNATLRRH